jgi:glycosyltransferase involved in cell wall biosynthesis
MSAPSSVSPACPRISIITPSFNQRQFLADCLESVLGQHYPNLEYIIIDGGSTDGSLDLIRRHQAHLAYWVSQPDGGQSEAINKGLGRATGQLVAWLNSDDFYLPNALALAAQSYLSHPAASFYFGNGYRVDQTGQIKRPHFGRWPYRFHRPALIFGLNYIMQPATFINRHYLSQAGLLDVRLHYGLDTDLWLRLSALAQPQAIPALLAASREYETTKTASGSFARVEELRQLAAGYAGQPITPGVICYFLDTLYQTAGFPAAYRRSILRFWADTSLLLEQYGAGPDGFPLPDDEIAAPLPRLKRRGWLYLRNWLKGYLAH